MTCSFFFLKFRAQLQNTSSIRLTLAVLKKKNHLYIPQNFNTEKPFAVDRFCGMVRCQSDQILQMLYNKPILRYVTGYRFGFDRPDD